MSFDLFILFDKMDKTTQIMWLEKLEKVGIECGFPKEFVIGSDCEGETLVQCKLNPPLVKESTDFEEYEFYFEPMDVDKENIADMIASTSDEELKQKLKKVKSEILLYSSAGRDDYALIVQCFAAATLADVSDGILFDPQEFGAVYGEKAYQVATHHCQHELSKGIENHQETTSQINVVQASPKTPKTKGVSTTLIILLILLFIAIRNIILS